MRRDACSTEAGQRCRQPKRLDGRSIGRRPATPLSRNDLRLAAAADTRSDPAFLGAISGVGEPGLPRERIRAPGAGERCDHKSRATIDGDDFGPHTVTPVHPHFAALAGSNARQHLCVQGTRSSGPVTGNAACMRPPDTASC